MIETLPTDDLTPDNCEFLLQIMKDWENEFGEPTNPAFEKEFDDIMEKLRRRVKL